VPFRSRNRIDPDDLLNHIILNDDVVRPRGRLSASVDTIAPRTTYRFRRLPENEDSLSVRKEWSK
jgi:hypothetical protein